MNSFYVKKELRSMEKLKQILNFKFRHREKNFEWFFSYRRYTSVHILQAHFTHCKVHLLYLKLIIDKLKFQTLVVLFFLIYLEFLNVSSFAYEIFIFFVGYLVCFNYKVEILAWYLLNSIFIWSNNIVIDYFGIFIIIHNISKFV